MALPEKTADEWQRIMRETTKTEGWKHFVTYALDRIEDRREANADDLDPCTQGDIIKANRDTNEEVKRLIRFVEDRAGIKLPGIGRS